MGPFSSTVQHHEFLDVSSSHLLWNTKAECHVEESSRKEDRRRTTCCIKSEASMFGIKKPLERKTNHFHRFGCFVRPRRVKSWVRIVQEAQGNLRETGAKTQQRAFSRVRRRWQSVSGHVETCAIPREPTWKDKVWVPQSSSLRFFVHWESLEDPPTQVELFGERNMRDFNTNVLIWGLFMSTTKKASVHLGPSYNENLEENWNNNFEELKTLFDITQEVDLRPEFRDSECFHDWVDTLSLDGIFTVTTKWSSGLEQQYASTRIQCYVWEKCMNIQKRMKNGKINS